MQELKMCDKWKSTNVGLNPPVNCPLENGKWYEIGTLSQFGNGFYHQGIRIFNDDGFMDDNGYWLKPFPTHFKEIELTQPDIDNISK